MKCPHCGKGVQLKVIESRHWEDTVWRRRLCGICCKTFVTAERGSKDLKFPYELNMKYQYRTTAGTSGK